MFTRVLGAAVLALGAGSAMADTTVKLALDWNFEGPAAPYLVPLDDGTYAKSGLSVEVSPGQGSLDAIPKVATGAYEFGFADINSLVKFIDQNPGAPVIMVMMTYDKPPFAVIGRKSLGVTEPKDLEGKVLGAPPPDGAWAQFKPFAAANAIDMDKIKVEPVGFPTREPMLAEGKVAAVTGYNYSSVLNAERLGVPAEDLSVILMADHGLDLYGNGIIVNTAFAEAHPEEVRAFLAAVAHGWQAAKTDGTAATKSVLKRNPAGDLALETRRLGMVVEANVATPYVMEHGMGHVDAARFDRALAQLATTYTFKAAPDASKYFTDAYLPEGGFPLE